MLIYVAGAYTAPTKEEVQAHIDRAEEVGKLVLEHGYVPLIPHRITAFWDIDPRFAHMQHGCWMNKVCIPWLNRCDAIVMVPGWQESKGAVMEHQHASNRGIPIFYACADLREMAEISVATTATL